MSRAKDFAKSLIILSFGTILPKLSHIITLPIVTGGLTQDEYGTYDLVTTLVSLFLPLVTLQIQSAAFRFLINDREDEEKVKTIISTILAYCVITSIIALVALYFCLFKLSNTVRSVICFYFFVDIIFRVVQQVARGFSMNKTYSVSSILESILNMLLVILFIGCHNLGMIGVLLAITFSEIIACGLTIMKGKILVYFSFRNISMKTLKSMVMYSWPMVPNSLSSWVLKFSDRMVLSFFMGVSANAVYAVANKLPGILSMVMSSFTMAWQENASVSVNDDDVREYYSLMFDVVYRFMAGTLAVLIAVTPILFSVLINGEYKDAYIHISILYMAVYFDCIKAYLGGIYVAKMKTTSIGITTLIAAGINLVIDLALVTSIGIFAASLSTLISCMFLALYRMYDIQKIQKIDFDIPKFFLIICCLTMMCIFNSINIVLLNIANIIIAILFTYAINRELIKQITYKFLKKT